MTDPSSASSLAASSASSASSSSSPPRRWRNFRPFDGLFWTACPRIRFVVGRRIVAVRTSTSRRKSAIWRSSSATSPRRRGAFHDWSGRRHRRVGGGVGARATRLGEQASAIQRLDADLEAVRALVEDTVAELSEGGSESGSGSGLGTVLDKCAALHAVDDEHVKSILPAADAADTAMAALHEHCARCKDAMTACVHRQLQSISALQSKIRDMRNKQAAFGEIGQRQEAAFRELRVARRVPRAYRACLAEVARRAAHAKVFGAQARQLAERMARGRAKEATRREAFARTHERYLPQDVASALGLGAHPPRCEVTVVGNGADEFPLVKVTDDDLRRAGGRRAPRSARGRREPATAASTAAAASETRVGPRANGVRRRGLHRPRHRPSPRSPPPPPPPISSPRRRPRERRRRRRRRGRGRHRARWRESRGRAREPRGRYIAGGPRARKRQAPRGSRGARRGARRRGSLARRGGVGGERRRQLERFGGFIGGEIGVIGA